MLFQHLIKSSNRRMGPCGAFQTICALLVAGAVVDSLNEPILVIVYSLSMMLIVKPCRCVENLKIWKVGTGLLGFVNCTSCFPLLAIYLEASENGCLIGTPLEGTTEWLSMVLETPQLNLGSAGGNSFSQLNPFTGLMKNIGQIFDMEDPNALYPTVRVEFLRTNGIANDCRKIDDLPSIPHEQVVANWKASISHVRWSLIMALMCILACFTVHFIVGIVILSVLAVGFAHQKCGLWTSRALPMHNFEDGVYLLRLEVLGYEWDHAIGTAYNGVLHVPYHFVGNMPICYSGRFHTAYSEDVENDVVTFGGPLQFGSTEDEVYVNVETKAGRVTYRVPVVPGLNGFSYRGVTTPGESGSPIWKKTGDALVLVGIAGRWWNDKDGVLEFVTGNANRDPDAVQSLSLKTGLQKILRHPGFGKTRKVLPELIEQHLADRKDKKVRIIVLGPTRVVCSELYSGLKSKYGQMVSLNIKGSGQSGFGQICIMAHHTYWEICTRHGGLALGPTMIVIDEVHARDISTKILRKISLKASERIPVVWMTATEEPDFCEGSNYPIEDIKLDSIDDVEDTIVKEIANGKSVGVFLPSIEGKYGTRAWTVKYQTMLNEEQSEAKVIELNRTTFEKVMRSAAMKEDCQKLIFMTNIAEMGMNLDLDVVVDLGKEFAHVQNGDIVDGTMRTMCVASKIQRRGRIGRTKNGTYYYLEDAVPAKDQLRLAIDKDTMQHQKQILRI